MRRRTRLNQRDWHRSVACLFEPIEAVTWHVANDPANSYSRDRGHSVKDPLLSIIMLSIIDSRQYEEWQNLRYLDPSSTEVRLRVQKFCANICRVLRQPSFSPEERRQAEARRVVEDERRRQVEGERINEDALATAGGDDSKQSHWTFISFCTQDRKAATEILHELERAGVRCWIATRDVRGGRDYQVAIVNALKQADSMVLVFSNAANNSEDVAREVALASKRKILILPVRIEDASPTEAIEYQITTRQFIDLFDDQKEKMNSEEFRFVPRTRPSVWWQADCARAGPLHCCAKENSPWASRPQRRGGVGLPTSCGSRCTRSWSSWPCFCGYSSGAGE